MRAAAKRCAQVGAAALVVRRAAAKALADGDASPEGLLVLVLADDADWAQVGSVLRALCTPTSAAVSSGVPTGDLFSLANALASVADGAVSLVDTVGRVIGYSTLPEQPIDELRRQTTLALKEVVPPTQDVDYRILTRSDVAHRFPAPDAESFGRVGRGIRSGGEFLGTIWVIVTDPSQADRIAGLLDSVEPLVAEHVRQARVDALDNEQRQSDLLRTLFEDPANAAAAMLGLEAEPEGPYTVLCHAVDRQGDEAPVRREQRLLYVANGAARLALGWSRTAILGPFVVTLARTDDPVLCRQVAEQVGRGSDGGVVTGVGRPVASLAGGARTYRQALAVTRLLLVPPASRLSEVRRSAVAHFDEVREEIAVRSLRESTADRHLVEDDAADRLTRRDAEQGTDLARTLLTYLNLRESVRATAERLHVHQNTVRYRIDVARHDLGIDLDQPSVRLWLWLRLTTRAAFPSGTGSSGG